MTAFHPASFYPVEYTLCLSCGHTREQHVPPDEDGYCTGFHVGECHPKEACGCKAFETTLSIRFIEMKWGHPRQVFCLLCEKKIGEVSEILSPATRAWFIDMKRIHDEHRKLCCDPLTMKSVEERMRAGIEKIRQAP